jgi:membrane-associated phospholipid phosphatase
MFDLTRPWPLGLSRRSWPWFCLGIVAGVGLFCLLDISLSRGMIGWPDSWRAPFFMITDYGLSDWVLIPTLIAFVAIALLLVFLRGAVRLAAVEMLILSGFIFVGVGLPGLIANGMKRLIGRGRPTEFDASGAFSFHNVFNDWTFQSFPSGHTTTAVALAFVIGFVWPRLFPWLLAIGLIVGFSRVPIGMHYPSDVFGGVVVGVLGAYLVRNVFARRGWLFTTRADGRVVSKGFPSIRQLARRARA